MNHTTEMKAAFINAQVEMMRAEREMMLVENLERKEQGLSLAYGSKQWADFSKRWESVLGYNAILWYFNQES